MLPRVNILGVGVSHVSPQGAVKYIDELISRGAPTYVCVCNVHNTVLCQRDNRYRRIHNQAAMVTPDGKPLCWVQRLKGYPQRDRVYGPDLMLAVCKEGVEKGYSHYFYGGRPGVPEKLAEVLAARFPGLKVAGAYSPGFDKLSPEEDERHAGMINESGADIVWVGLGAPKQELWMGGHVGRIHAPVMVGVGAAFDFHTGGVRQAPKWMQDHGLEWFFRFCMEPRRLWRRYLINNPIFVTLILLQLLGIRRYPLEGVEDG